MAFWIVFVTSPVNYSGRGGGSRLAFWFVKREREREDEYLRKTLSKVLLLWRSFVVGRFVLCVAANLSVGVKGLDSPVSLLQNPGCLLDKWLELVD